MSCLLLRTERIAGAGDRRPSCCKGCDGKSLASMTSGSLMAMYSGSYQRGTSLIK